MQLSVSNLMPNACVDYSYGCICLSEYLWRGPEKPVS